MKHPPNNVRCWQITQTFYQHHAVQTKYIRGPNSSVGHHFEISDLMEWMEDFLVILWLPVGQGLGQSMGRNNSTEEDKTEWKVAWGHGTQLALTELWSHYSSPSYTKCYLNFHIFPRGMVTSPFDRCVSRETRTRTQVSWLPVVLFLIHTTENPATNLHPD